MSCEETAMLALIPVLALLGAASFDTSSGPPSQDLGGPDRAGRDRAALRVAIGAVGEPDADRIVCKKEAAVGSRREKKYCFTRFEWDQREEAANRMMDTTLWGSSGQKAAPGVR
jgi:hypothetical protein